MARRRRRASGKTYKPKSAAFLDAMEEAAELAESGELSQAQALLEALNQRYPKRPEVLTDLINLCIQMNDVQAMRGYAEDLLEITPNDANVMHLLSGAYLLTTMPSMALRTLRRFVERFPEDEREIGRASCRE